ncbi:hypothetical protein KKF84_13965, partial [Myxococcota bacterium]|nr:hypothetical protein [Myxococcota bacterium]
MPDQTGTDTVYYLRHFLTVVRHSLTRYGDLLYPEEREIAEAFLSLGPLTRQLYTRLFNRKHRWFLPETIVYAELPNIDFILEELCAAGFASLKKPTSMDWDEIFPVITRGHLAKALCPGKPRGTKSEMGERVRTILTGNPLLLDPMVQLHHAEVFELLLLLFFGNPYQDMTTLVLDEIDTTRYPSYTVSGERLFHDRERLNAYLAARTLEQNLHELLEQGEQNRVLDEVDAILEHFERSVASLPAVYFGRNAEHIFGRIVQWFAQETHRLPPATALNFLARATALKLPPDIQTPLQERLSI